MTLFSAILNRRPVPMRDPCQCEGSTGNIIERLKMPSVDSDLSPAETAGSRFQKEPAKPAGSRRWINVVQHHLQLPYMAPPEYLPEMGTHQAQERRAVGTLGQLRWTTARKTPLEVWLPGNLSLELWWFPSGLTGYQSGPDLKRAPAGSSTRTAWRVLHCGSA
jgi:hypothetical protein